MEQLPDRVKRREQVISQQVDGQEVLLNLASGQYYALDEVGSRIWSLCDGTRAVGDVVAVLCQEYDAPAATIEDDARELLADLLDARLVVDIA